MKIQLSDPHYTREDALLIPMMYHFYRKYFRKVDAQLQYSPENDGICFDLLKIWLHINKEHCVNTTESKLVNFQIVAYE